MKRSTKRGIDDLGRITVPADFREELGIEAGDALEVYMEDGSIGVQGVQTRLKRNVRFESK